MIFDAPPIVRTNGAPGFVVNAVRGINGAFPPLNPFCPGIHHFEILKVKEPSALAGDEQNRFSRVTVDLELHVPAKIAAVMFKIPDFHNRSLFCVYCGL